MRPQRLLQLVNPNSGRKHAVRIASDARRQLTAAGITVDEVRTTGAGHARQVMRDGELAAYDGVAVVGGDGTLHEVVSGMLEREDAASRPIGLIPAGSGNDVAQQLQLETTDVAVRRIVNGATLPIDVARVVCGSHVDYSVTLVGWAGVADINCRAERWRWMGPRRYSLAAA